MFRKRVGTADDAPAAARRVLLAGDNPDSTELLTRLLVAAGCTVERAATPTDLLDGVRASGPDCVVLDMTLPGSHGAGDLLTMVRAAPDADVAAVRVVVCGNRSLEPLALFDAGADDVLVRPVRATELVEAVRAAADLDPAERASHTARRRAAFTA